MYCWFCVKLIRPDHTGLQCTAHCTRTDSRHNLTHSAQPITSDPRVGHYHDPVSRLQEGLTVKILHAFLPFSFLLVLSQNLRFAGVERIVWPKYLKGLPFLYLLSFFHSKYEISTTNSKPFFVFFYTSSPKWSDGQNTRRQWIK